MLSSSIQTYLVIFWYTPYPPIPIHPLCGVNEETNTIQWEQNKKCNHDCQIWMDVSNVAQMIFFCKILTKSADFQYTTSMTFQFPNDRKCNVGDRQKSTLTSEPAGLVVTFFLFVQLFFFIIVCKSWWMHLTESRQTFEMTHRIANFRETTLNLVFCKDQIFHFYF